MLLIRYARRRTIWCILVLLVVLYFMITLAISGLLEPVAKNPVWNRRTRLMTHAPTFSKLSVTPVLYGKIKPNLEVRDIVEANEILANYGILKGGMHIPEEATKSKVPSLTLAQVAIIIPLRDRESQLATFLIFAIVQSKEGLFNRAKLFNVGIVESAKYDDFDCFVFHDVDFLLENDHLIYGCEHSPTHFGVAPSQFGYRMYSSTYCGGVVAASKSHIYKVNGFSNCYWSWGFEDDDIHSRFKNQGFTIFRPDESVARYLSNPNDHTQSHHGNHYGKNRDRYLHMNDMYLRDGLNSLHYTSLDTEELNLYTRITVDLTGKDNCDDLLEEVKRADLAHDAEEHYLI